jgi:hypothetical protein
MINFITYVNEKLKINKDFKKCNDFYYESEEEIAEEIINTFCISNDTDKAIERTIKVLKTNNINNVHRENILFTTEDRYIKYLPEEIRDKYFILCKEYDWRNIGIKRYFINSIGSDNKYKLYYRKERAFANYYLEIIYFDVNNSATYVCTIQE